MNNIALTQLLIATWETVYMVFVASFISIFVGTAIGVFLFLTGAQHPFEIKW